MAITSMRCRRMAVVAATAVVMAGACTAARQEAAPATAPAGGPAPDHPEQPAVAPAVGTEGGASAPVEANEPAAEPTARSGRGAPTGSQAAGPARGAAAEVAAREIELARASREGGRVRDAIIHYEQALREDPSSSEARLAYTELLLEQSIDLGRARALLGEAGRQRPGDVRVDRLRGWLDELQGNDAAAADDYERVLAMEPDPDLRTRRANILMRLRRLDDAVQELERVAAERPGDRGVRMTLAEVFEYEGRTGDAERMLTEIAQIAPADPGPLHRLAAFYRRCGQLTKAAETEARARSLEGAPRSLRPLRPSRR